MTLSQQLFIAYSYYRTTDASMAPNPSEFSDSSSFVQFALGIGASIKFKELLLHLGVPAAVLCALILLAYKVGLKPTRITS